MPGMKTEIAMNKVTARTRREITPLRGHRYHSLTNEELRFILRDAGLAANAMRGHDEKAENKYLDQQNDANTILGWRARKGVTIGERVP